MKKLLFILMPFLSLCACSSDDESRSSSTNQILYNGKAYRIDSVTLGYGRKICMYSGNYHLVVQDYQSRFSTEENCFVQNLGSSFFDDTTNSRLCDEWSGVGNNYHFTYDDGTESWGVAMGESSYVDIQKIGNQHSVSIMLTDNENSKRHTLKATYLGSIKVVK